MGLAFALFAVLLGIAILIFWVWRRRQRRKQNSKAITTNDPEDREHGKSELEDTSTLSPELSPSTAFSPISIPLASVTRPGLHELQGTASRPTELSAGGSSNRHEIGGTDRYEIGHSKMEPDIVYTVGEGDSGV